MKETFKVNVIGPTVMVESFAPLLSKSKGTPRIVNITSDAGSITKRLDPTSPGYQYPGITAYRASKAALNMVTACQAVVYGNAGFKVFAYNPGFTVSTNGPSNDLEHGAKAAIEAAVPIARIINGDCDGEHGCFLHATGQHPW